jgi:hypothetical protein
MAEDRVRLPRARLVNSAASKKLEMHPFDAHHMTAKKLT